MMFTKRIFLPIFLTISGLYGQQRMMNSAFAIGGDRDGRDALGLCCSTQASLGNNPTVMNFFSDFKAALGNNTFTKASGYAKVQGSAYYDLEFKKGTIYSNGEEVAEFYVRYDAFNDDIEVKKNEYNLTTESLVRSENLSCEVDGEKWVYHSFVNSDGIYEEGYMTILYEGELHDVYVRNKKVFKEGKEAKTSFATNFPPRFLDKTEYYVSTDGSAPQHLKLKKRDVLAYFDGIQRENINELIKKKSLKFDIESDLAEVFKYADSEKTIDLTVVK